MSTETTTEIRWRASLDEALYWAAVSRYKGSHDAADLIGGWERLRAHYPESIWRTKQSFSEM